MTQAVGHKNLAERLPATGARGNARARDLLLAVAVVGCLPSVAWAQRPDLGDAPDSFNSAGALMTAYPGVPAFFPTTYQARLNAAMLPGPLHYNSPLLFFLGSEISPESDAEPPFADADATNNILPAANSSDLDAFDDSLVLPASIPHCQLMQLQFFVTALAGAPPSAAFANLWFDWNRNGRWGDVPICSMPVGPVPAPEWAVQNMPLSLPAGPAYVLLTTPPFLAWNPEPQLPLWLRITVSEPSDLLTSSGSGPPNGLQFGETEDYLMPSPVGVLGDGPAPRLSGRPNPFVSGTTISYGLARGADVRLEVFDPGGRLVRTLVHATQAAGSHVEVWDGKDDLGHGVPVGAYLVRLEAEGSSGKLKVVRLR